MKPFYHYYYERLDESNKALTTRMERMEHRSPFNSMSVVPRLHSQGMHQDVTIPLHNVLKGAPNIPDCPAVRGSDLTAQNQVG